MGLLDQLGRLAGAALVQPQLQPGMTIPWPATSSPPMMMQYVPGPICIHGLDCQECLARQKRLDLEMIKAAKLAEKKKKDYEKRCRLYLRKFRKPL